MRSWHWAALGAAGVVVAGGLWIGAGPPAGDEPAVAVAPAGPPAPPVARPPVFKPAASTVSAAVAASSPAPRRPVPAWTRLTLETSLADVLAAAQAGGSPAELLVAGRLLSTCTSARNATEQRLAATNEMRLSAMLPEPAASAAARQSSQAHRTLLRYCAALDDPGVEALAQAVRQRLASTPSTWLALADQPFKSRGETWPQDQYQAALLTLTDPTGQAATLETVLRLLTPPPPPGRMGLNNFQADVVRVLVAQELTGDRNPLSVANTSACVQRAVCDVTTPAFAADPANRLVLAATQHWVQLIRTQQWAAIGLLSR